MQEIARQHVRLQSSAGCRLVPYGEHHVETYHEWMKDPWLQEMTASEPLTMEEEVAMQKEWATDPESTPECTFIVEAADPSVDSGYRMAGDVNLFVLDAPEGCAEDTLDLAAVRCVALQPRQRRWASEAGTAVSAGAESIAAPAAARATPPRKVQAEVMVMVAEADFRRKGLARAAVQGIMRFALTSAELRQRVHVTSFIAKISTHNAASIKLFESLGFVKTAEVAAFDEVHFTWWPCANSALESGKTNLARLLEAQA